MHALLLISAEHVLNSAAEAAAKIALRRGTLSGVKEVVVKIDHYVQKSNRHAQPFVCTATADSIFAKVEQLCGRIYETAHSDCGL